MEQIGFSSSNADSILVIVNEPFFVIVQNGGGCLDDGVSLCTLASPGKDRTHFGLICYNASSLKLIDQPNERESVPSKAVTNYVKFLHGFNLLPVSILANNS